METDGHGETENERRRVRWHLWIRLARVFVPPLKKASENPTASSRLIRPQGGVVGEKMSGLVCSDGWIKEGSAPCGAG